MTTGAALVTTRPTRPTPTATATGSGRIAPDLTTRSTTAPMTAAGGTRGTEMTPTTGGSPATSSTIGQVTGAEHSGTLTRLPTAPEDPWLRGPARRCQPPRRHDSAYSFKCTPVYK